MTASGVSVSTGRGTMDESLYANKSLTAPGFWRRAVVRSLRSRCARQVTGAQDAGVRHRPDRVRLGGCAPYVSRPAQDTRLFPVQPLIHDGADRPSRAMQLQLSTSPILAAVPRL